MASQNTIEFHRLIAYAPETELIQYLHSKPNIDINYNRSTDSALIQALIQRKHALAIELIKMGARPNKSVLDGVLVDDFTFTGPLEDAAKLMEALLRILSPNEMLSILCAYIDPLYLELMNQLIYRYKPNVNYKNPEFDDDTAAMTLLLVWENNEATYPIFFNMFKLLAENGLNPAVKDYDGRNLYQLINKYIASEEDRRILIAIVEQYRSRPRQIKRNIGGRRSFRPRKI
jgi:hypothetical protein